MVDKKGQVNFLRIAIIGFVIAVITLTIGMSVNDTVTTTQKGDSTAIVNESLGNTTLNAETVLADILDINNASSVTDIACVLTDDADGTTLTTGSYKIRADKGTYNISNVSHDGQFCIINYSYYPHGDAYNASVLGTAGLATFADYWAVIAIVVILAVIIGLFGLFGGATGGLEVR